MTHHIRKTIFFAWLAVLPILIATMESVDAHGRPTGAPQKASGPVSFVSEVIDLRIGENRVSVTGCYHMRSDLPGTHPAPLAYPFPIGASSEYPDTIRVFHGKNLTPVKFDEDRSGGMVFINIEAEGDFEFTVYYSQRIHAREAVYILTTTKKWGAPLDSAVFRITLPDSLIPAYWSFSPDQVEKGKNDTTYAIHRTNFLPDHDLTVRWKPKKGMKR